MLARTLVLLIATGGLSAVMVPSFASARPATEPRVARAAVSRALTLTVVVQGLSAPGGRVGTALFTTPAGFPDAPVPLSLLHPHTVAVADTFVFRDVAPGRYAIAVQHDLNANGVVDRNLVGAPKEPWGVSRDIRHTFRAPRFDEAVIDVRADTTIVVRVAR